MELHTGTKAETMLHRTIPLLYGASLLTLPWVGLGLIRWLTGIDSGAGLQPSWLFLALAIVLLAFSQMRRLGPGPALSGFWSGIPGPWRLGFGLALLAILLSGFGMMIARVQESTAIVGSRYLRQVIQLVIMGFFVLWPALWTRGAQRWRWTIRLLVISALLQAGYGLLQGISYYYPNGLYNLWEQIFTSNPSILSGSEQLYLGNVFRDVPRLRGTVCEPLYLGNFLLLVLPWLLVSEGSDRKRIAIGLVLGALMLGTWSRGAWLGLVAEAGAAVVLLVISRWHNSAAKTDWHLPRASRLGGVLGGLIALALLAGVILGRDALLLPMERLLQTFSRQDWSNLTRLYAMDAAWQAFQLSPWLGVGWGQFAWHFPVLADPMGLQSQFDWPMVNNFPLQILCETGAAGFLVFLGITFGLGKATVGRIRQYTAQRAMVFPAALAVIGVWTQLLSFSQYNLPHIWVAVGLLMAALRDDSFTNDGGQS